MGDLEKWLPDAQKRATPQNPLRLPYDVALREAGGLAGFHKRYWSPVPGRAGLVSVQNRLPETAGDELLSVIKATQQAHTQLLLLVDPVVVDKGERARFLVDELESAIEFVLDDGVQEPADEKLAKIQEFHAQEGERSSSLSQKLKDFAALAAELQPRIVEADSSFDVALIGEAAALGDALAAAPAQSPPDASAVEAATRTRNGFLVLMLERMAQIRSAARRVFRRNPDIVREAGSAYERRRRAAARRAEKARKDEAKEGNKT